MFCYESFKLLLLLLYDNFHSLMKYVHLKLCQNLNILHFFGIISISYELIKLIFEFNFGKYTFNIE